MKLVVFAQGECERNPKVRASTNCRASEAGYCLLQCRQNALNALNALLAKRTKDF